jgi:hypothetical protein
MSWRARGQSTPCGAGRLSERIPRNRFRTRTRRPGLVARDPLLRSPRQSARSTFQCGRFLSSTESAAALSEHLRFSAMTRSRNMTLSDR